MRGVVGIYGAQPSEDLTKVFVVGLSKRDVSRDEEFENLVAYMFSCEALAGYFVSEERGNGRLIRWCHLFAGRNAVVGHCRRCRHCMTIRMTDEGGTCLAFQERLVRVRRSRG